MSTSSHSDLTKNSRFNRSKIDLIKSMLRRAQHDDRTKSIITKTLFVIAHAFFCANRFFFSFSVINFYHKTMMPHTEKIFSSPILVKMLLVSYRHFIMWLDYLPVCRRFAVVVAIHCIVGQNWKIISFVFVWQWR